MNAASRPPGLLGFLYRAQALGADRPAISSPSATVTYGDLLARVLRIAAQLPTPVRGSGELVAVLAEHDLEVPELYLGVLEAGHAVVPVSSRLPTLAIRRVLEKADVRVAFAAPSAGHRLDELTAAIPEVTWLTPGDGSATDLLPRTGTVPVDTAMVCFTSGTTGEPKGVILTHANLITHALTSLGTYAIDAAAVHINPMPLAHFAGASRVILAVANAGNHVILPGFDADGVLAAIDRWSGTHLMVVPTMAADLLTAREGATGRAADLSSLQTLVYGAAPMPMPVARALADILDCGLINGYGLTESSALATALGPDAHRQAVRTGDHELLGTVGTPVPGVELAILDADLHELPAGEVGEIALRGQKVSPGYFRNPVATAEKHLQNGWLRSGDQGQLVEGGNLRLLGRIDDMMITGGINVQPLEIEGEVREFAGVQDCAAFAIPSDRWGQEIRLAIVSMAEETVDTTALQTYLLSRMDKYKTPKAIHLVHELPRTSVGKIQRFKLAEMAADGLLGEEKR